jgi:hypothetical protein
MDLRGNPEAVKAGIRLLVFPEDSDRQLIP